MIWNREPPKDRGYYWVVDGSVVAMVQVVRDSGGTLKVLEIGSTLMHSLKNYEWWSNEVEIPGWLKSLKGA